MSPAAGSHRLVILSRRPGDFLLAACKFAFGADHRSFIGQDACPFSVARGTTPRRVAVI
jgi:hypothetical protein